jgi:hypothetical protein
MRPWVYEYEEILTIDKLPEGTVGFIYRIDNNVTGKYYIGKKALYSTRTKALTKKEQASLPDKRMSKKKKVVTESDWKTYMGSNAELKKDITLYGSDNFFRSILHLCCNKSEMTYHEARIQFFLGVLEDDNCYCDNILGKFYRHK